MGIDYQASLVVGLPSDDLNIERGEDGNYDEDELLNLVPPYYDADEGIIGIEIITTRAYSYKEVDVDKLISDIAEAKETFLKLTGVVGKLYLSPKGW